MDPNTIRLAFQSRDAGFTEWELKYNDEYWVVSYRCGENYKFENVADVCGLTVENKDTERHDALVMAMAMVTAMEECWDRCDWPQLLRIAKKNGIAYGT